MRFVSGTKLDERVIRCDLDPGYRDGRQYGRGRSGGQVRDEYRQEYDAGRGGWGHNRLREEEAVIVLGAQDKGKFPFIVAATDKAVERGVKSGDVVKQFGQYVDGRGGGKPDMAQGSGSSAAGAERGFAAVEDMLESL